MRDAAARDERLSVVLLEDPEVDGLCELETGGGGLNGVCGVENGFGRSGRAQTAHECAGREDDPPVGRDVDGRVGIEDLEALEPLVQIHVGNAAVAALHDARCVEVGQVGARDAEVGRMRVDVGERGIERIAGGRVGRCD